MMDRNLLAFASDQRGSMAIETAFVVPLLILLTLGMFEVSTIVSRQHEMQSAAAEVEVIALAAASGATTSVEQVKDIVKASIDLEDDQIKVTQFYRCNDSESTVANKDMCDEDDVVSRYLELELRDTYTPTWTEFGVGEPFKFEVDRVVFLS